MNRDLRAFIPAALAALFLALIALQSIQAFQRTGRWGIRPKSKYLTSVDPTARLEAILSAPDEEPPITSIRNPFDFGRGPVMVRRSGGAMVRQPEVTPAAPRPVLTAVITGQSDPRAVIAWAGRSYDVKAGDLFADFRVVSISADEVVLDTGRERLVLQRPTKGR